MAIFSSRIRKRIENFSNRLKGVAGSPLPALSVEDWWIETENYYVYPETHAWNGWQLMLEAAPKVSMTTNNEDGRLDWIDHLNPPLPSEWHYRYNGTNTENLPPPDLQAAIIHEVINSADLMYRVAPTSITDSGSTSSPIIDDGGTSSPISVKCKYCGNGIDFTKGSIVKGGDVEEKLYYFCTAACSISFDQMNRVITEVEEEIESRFDILDL